MNRDALEKIIQQAVFLGQVQYMTMMNPERDVMKQREAARYLKNLGYEPKLLDEWREKGFIHRRKDGDGNHLVYYSLKEIQRQITITEMVKGNITNIYP